VKHARIDMMKEELTRFEPIEFSGVVHQLIGLTVECIGPMSLVGDLCRIFSQDGVHSVEAEVVGFNDNRIYLMPYGKLDGIGPGSKVVALDKKLDVRVGDGLMGRILDGLGRPMDGLGPVACSEVYASDNVPPNPLSRKRIDTPLELGVRALDGLLTCGIGQRLGVFAGSGVGKSTLMGMIARNAQVDVNVIVLVGERGREVREFIEKDLKEEGLHKSVVVVATSDQPAIIRQKCAMVGTSIAEYFRDQGKNVLLLMDSLTRFAMAQREIGMSIGEPPVSRGYTPSVFQVLPRLLERSGNNSTGSITGIYTVLVEGDDQNEPIADTVRGILDGHVVLSRKLAHQNHYPAIDVLSSVSRVMPDIVSKEQLKLAGRVKRNMSVYKEAEDLIQVGAYKKGSVADIDESIFFHPRISDFLRQEIEEQSDYRQTLDAMRLLLEN
jgi:flagellum-specific ATP synthase